MIQFGPAGIPLSCKGRTVRDGIIYTRNLELDAMEVQFVRGIRMTEDEARTIRQTAEESGVELHVKAPYYINLAGDEKNIEMSQNKILATGKLAHEMGAQTVVFHPGFYGELSKEETQKRIVQNLRNLRNVFVSEGWTPRLGMEVMGKRNVFGSLDEVLEVCRRVKGIVPVIDFAHIHARGNGVLQNPEDFQAIFDRLAPLHLEHYLIHFTGIHYENGNARYRLPIKKGDLKFEPLCEVLLENNYSATIISTSPIMEHDAMYMNIVFDRVYERLKSRRERDVREAKDSEERRIRDEERKKILEEERRSKEEDKERIRLEKEAEKAAREAEKVRLKEEELAKRLSIPDCEALTKAGTQCKKKADGRGKYCIQHKGWRGATIRDLPENNTPAVVESDDSGRRQVQVNRWFEKENEPAEPEVYKLYKKDNRFYFSREKKDGYAIIFKVPQDKEVAYNKNGIPLLRAKQQ